MGFHLLDFILDGAQELNFALLARDSLRTQGEPMAARDLISLAYLTSNSLFCVNFRKLYKISTEY